MEPGRERSRHARTICPAAEKCGAAVRIMRADLLGLLPADSCRVAAHASDGTCAAACIARTACVMCAAHLLPRNRCAARLNSRRRYAPMLPRWAVARVDRVRVVALSRCRVAPGLRYPLRVLPPSALCARLACVAAVIRRGPLSRSYMWITRLLLYNILV